MESDERQFLSLCNRGGLTKPSDLVFIACVHSWSLYCFLFNDPELWDIVISSYNPREVFTQVYLKELSLSANTEKMLKEKCDAGCLFKDKLKQIAVATFNLKAKNYTSEANDAIRDEKNQKKRTHDDSREDYKQSRALRKVKNLTSSWHLFNILKLQYAIIYGLYVRMCRYYLDKHISFLGISLSLLSSSLPFCPNMVIRPHVPKFLEKWFIFWKFRFALLIGFQRALNHYPIIILCFWPKCPNMVIRPHIENYFYRVYQNCLTNALPTSPQPRSKNNLLQSYDQKRVFVDFWFCPSFIPEIPVSIPVL